jgi:hypothetical protein
MNYSGAIKPNIKPTSFQFGANTLIKGEVMFPDGCLLWAPIFESQAGKYYDAFWCVSASFENQCEVFFNRWIEMDKETIDQIFAETLSQQADNMKDFVAEKTIHQFIEKLKK